MTAPESGRESLLSARVSSCSYRGRKGEPMFDYSRGIFPCFRKAAVTIRENMRKGGNPFREREVCRVHADEMIESGFYVEVGS